LRRGRRGRGRSAGQRTATNVQIKGKSNLTGLTGALAPDIDGQVRLRGEGYFRQGRVVLSKATPERLNAEVKGKGGDYHVTLDMAFDEKHQRTSVSGLCDCPFYGGGKGYCKHIWAAICLADGTPDCEFRAVEGHPVGFLSRFTTTTAPSRTKAVVSAEPDTSGRIRAFTSTSHATSHAVPQATKDSDSHKRPAHNHKIAHANNNDQVSWREALKLVGHAQREIVELRSRAGTKGNAQDVYYVIDAESSRKSGLLTVLVFRRAGVEGEAGSEQIIPVPIDLRALDAFAQGPDRDILLHFFGVATSTLTRSGAWDEGNAPLRPRSNSFAIADTLRPYLLEQMAATGRLGWLTIDDAKLEGHAPIDLAAFKALRWDAQEPWVFRLAVAVRKQDRTWIVRGEFRRGRITVPLSDTLLAFTDGLALFKDRVVRTNLPDPRLCAWMTTLKQVQTIKVQKADQAAFLRGFVDLPTAPPLDLPSDSGWRIVVGEARPRLIFLATPITDKAMVLLANYEFDYEAPPAEAPRQSQAPRQGQAPRPGQAPRQGQVPAQAAGTAAELRPAATASDEASAGATALALDVGLAVTGDDPAVAVAAGSAAVGLAPAPEGRRPGRRPRVHQIEAAPIPVPATAVPGKHPAALEVQAPPRVIIRRDRSREEHLIRELCSHHGVQASAGRGIAGADVFVDAADLATLVGDLATRGWSVEAEGKKLRTGRSFNVDVKSGVDWLDLRARFDFGGGVTVELPRLIEALRRGDNRVQLGDGTVGLLPEEWLKKLDPILRMGEDGAGDELRYRSSHAAFLDILVAEADHANLDQSFIDYRKKLAAFSGVAISEPQAEFVGELRPYQKQGLGWLEFLAEFGFGGCLADDMGLGKTVQVLAFLQKRCLAARAAGKHLEPTLIVAPTSLIYNWEDEAKRFVPDLKILAHVGAARERDAKRLRENDVIVTSYGTMRSDIDILQTIPFDHVVLDEAQAIKNEGTQSAKAARALKAKHRLAMSGTPVENRIAELGSIFRFLNPGMLDSAAAFGDLFSGSGKITPGKLETLAKALRPFILRRTKEQVLPDLPGKTESTVYCVLEPDQQREYDELAAHYRDTLKKKVKTVGIGKTRMHVLEALLRLRQLACHPGLIDKERIGENSAKMDLLDEQLQEVMDSGRKALVFSQFTSMLAIVRARLDAKGIVYEYLDGSTTDRKERVEHFQNDANVRVFLISLKAGGVGLNLTAADYCFILDPWWNPASEAQAIDRAHRIGQQNHVFAYRLITRGTVEEKILALQDSKRQLVEGIIADDGNVMADLTSKDLDFLFS